MRRSGKLGSGALLFAAILLLSVAAVYAQVDQLGLHFIRAQQAKVHEQMMQGVAGNPWQYRILGDLLVDPLIGVFRGRGVAGAEGAAFIAFRFIQCVLVLSLAALYYRRLGLSASANTLGLSILTWGMAFSLYNSDLSFNVFFDVAFYLLSGWLILRRKPWWVVVLMIPAALNRETSLLIPFMLGTSALLTRTPGERLRLLAAAAVALAVFSAIFVALRIHYGQQPFLTADGYYPGFGLLVLNLRRLVTWEQLLITLGIIPLLALLAYPRWPMQLRLFFWTVVPAWVGVHFVSALVAETRLMLVPQALVFIPAALLGLTVAPAGSSVPARLKNGSGKSSQ